MRRRSGWPENRIPNMSKTSRSNQLAEGWTSTSDGTISSSRTATFSRMRWFRYIDRKW
jgi:hypothetical protein